MTAACLPSRFPPMPELLNDVPGQRHHWFRRSPGLATFFDKPRPGILTFPDGQQSYSIYVTKVSNCIRNDGTITSFTMEYCILAGRKGGPLRRSVMRTEAVVYHHDEHRDMIHGQGFVVGDTADPERQEQLALYSTGRLFLPKTIIWVEHGDVDVRDGFERQSGGAWNNPITFHVPQEIPRWDGLDHLDQLADNRFYASGPAEARQVNVLVLGGRGAGKTAILNSVVSAERDTVVSNYYATGTVPGNAGATCTFLFQRHESEKHIAVRGPGGCGMKAQLVFLDTPGYRASLDTEYKKWVDDVLENGIGGLDGLSPYDKPRAKPVCASARCEPVTIVLFVLSASDVLAKRIPDFLGELAGKCQAKNIPFVAAITGTDTVVPVATDETSTGYLTRLAMAPGLAQVRENLKNSNTGRTIGLSHTCHITNITTSQEVQRHEDMLLRSLLRELVKESRITAATVEEPLE